MRVVAVGAVFAATACIPVMAYGCPEGSCGDIPNWPLRDAASESDTSDGDADIDDASENDGDDTSDSSDGGSDAFDASQDSPNDG